MILPLLAMLLGMGTCAFTVASHMLQVNGLRNPAPTPHPAHLSHLRSLSAGFPAMPTVLIRLGGPGTTTGLPDHLDVCLHAGIYRVLHLCLRPVHISIGGLQSDTRTRALRAVADLPACRWRVFLRSRPPLSKRPPTLRQHAPVRLDRGTGEGHCDHASCACVRACVRACVYLYVSVCVCALSLSGENIFCACLQLLLLTGFVVRWRFWNQRRSWLARFAYFAVGFLMFFFLFCCLSGVCMCVCVCG